MSYLFNGSSQYLKRTDTCGIADYPFTMSCWIKPSSFVNQTPVAFGSTTAANYQRAYLRDPADDDVLIYSRDDATSAWINTSTQYLTGSWQHVCCVFTSDTSRTVYLDGGNNQTSTTSIDYEAALDLTTIGALIHTNTLYDYFGGYIAEVSLHNIALSSGDITTLAGGTSADQVQNGNLVGYWKLIDDLVDSANSYDMTAFGSPTSDADHPTIDYGGDTTNPTVTINQAGSQTDPTSTSPINFTVVFSETVTGFETGDVTLSGTAGATTGTVTEISPMDGTTYNVAVSGMTGSGTVIATIEAGVAEDAAANPNDASTSTDNTVTYTDANWRKIVTEYTDSTLNTIALDDLTASTLVGLNTSKVSESVTIGTGLNYTRPTLSLSHLGLQSLTDPNDDRIYFWDDSETASGWLDLGNSLAITTTTFDTIQGIRTVDSPQFAGLDLTGITDGNIPYMSASGVANSPLSYDSVNSALLYTVNKLGTAQGSYNHIVGSAFAAKSGYSYCNVVGNNIANSATGDAYSNNLVGADIANAATGSVYRNNLVGGSLANSSTGGVYANNIVGGSLANSATGNIYYNNIVGTNIANAATGVVYYNNLVGYSLANSATGNVMYSYVVGYYLADVTGSIDSTFAQGYNCLRSITNETNLSKVFAAPYESLYQSSASDLDNAIAIGYRAGYQNTKNNPCLIGASSSATEDKQIAIGSSYYTGGIRLGGTDNIKCFYGTGDDAAIYYDGTNLVFSPRLVGTGGVAIGVGTAGVDYKLIFDGETNDGTLTWMEDEAIFQFDNYLRTSTSLYRRYYHLPINGFDPGASGATWTSADANHLAGWQLNAAGETLEFESDVHTDWDGATDLTATIRFQLLDAGSANDTVDLKLVCYYAGIGDTTTKTQTVEVATVTDGTQYKMYEATFTIDYDAVSNVVDAGDSISFILNLETDTSEIDNVIIVGGSFYYNTTHTGIESSDV